MALLHDRALLDWMGNFRDDGLTGFDHPLGQTSSWILHAAYLDPTAADTPGYKPRDVSGGGGGIDSPDSQHPAPGWLRRRWADLPNMQDPAKLEVPPSFRWFPPGSWPRSIHGPCEGTLDEVSSRALLQVLFQRSHGADSEVYAYYCPLVADDYDQPTLYRGHLGELPPLLPPHGRYRFTPSNLWPADRSWMVWTDYDLWASRISGPPDLIDAVEHHPDLDTLTWPAPHPPSS
ncbi:hypothetical protein [Kineococcus sp. SYSU DK003]|uniref:hypothetical protein n=1 Tax=Kineococcus sp. SYSU DK003 TaxID=3383124 RepID=UPI003D7E3888